jgi:hypothetical protein
VKTFSSLLVVIAIAAASQGLGCAAAQVGVSESSGGNNGGGSTPGGGSSGSSGFFVDTDASFTLPDTRKADLMADVQPFGYDDAGTPICLSILSLGQPAHYGAGSGTTDSTDAFQTYVNTYTKNANTGTTSVMTMVKKFTSLTDDFLSHYNVIILQALEDTEYNGLWSFTQSDTDALKRWVNDKGGALITMTGYGGNTTEVNPLNQLLSFSGISYKTDDIFSSCPDSMCYCTDSSIPFDGWQSDYADQSLEHNLTHDLKKVGVFHGRSINCTDSACQVFAKDSSGDKVGVAKVVGKGHVVAWADEWVTYTSQWGIQASQWDTHAECTGGDNGSHSDALNPPHTAKLTYNVPQFWNNVFSWSSPDMQWCFSIAAPPDADPAQTVIP